MSQLQPPVGDPSPAPGPIGFGPTGYGPTGYGPTGYGPGAGYPPPVLGAPPASALPLSAVEYHQMLRTPRARWWKGLLVILAFVAGYLLISTLLQVGAVAIDVARGRIEASSVLQGKLTLTPTLLLSVNLTNACAIPLAMLLQRAFYGQRGGWLHSVVGRFRWGLLARSALVVLPVWVVYLVLNALFAPPGPPGSALNTESVVLLVVVVLTTPLQAAGEEYGARGLLTRAAGSWVVDPRWALVIGTVVSAAIFMLAHGAGDPWLIVFYFFFGVGLSLVTWRTGGLEVGVLIHTVNNMVLFGISILAGQDLSQALDRSNGTGGPAVLAPIAMMVVLVAGVSWLTRRTRVDRFFRPAPAPSPEVPGLVPPWHHGPGLG